MIFWISLDGILETAILHSVLQRVRAGKFQSVIPLPQCNCLLHLKMLHQHDLLEEVFVCVTLRVGPSLCLEHYELLGKYETNRGENEKVGSQTNKKNIKGRKEGSKKGRERIRKEEKVRKKI